MSCVEVHLEAPRSGGGDCSLTDACSRSSPSSSAFSATACATTASTHASPALFRCGYHAPGAAFGSGYVELGEGSSGAKVLVFFRGRRDRRQLFDISVRGFLAAQDQGASSSQGGGSAAGSAAPGSSLLPFGRGRDRRRVEQRVRERMDCLLTQALAPPTNGQHSGALVLDVVVLQMQGGPNGDVGAADAATMAAVLALASGGVGLRDLAVVCTVVKNFDSANGAADKNPREMLPAHAAPPAATLAYSEILGKVALFEMWSAESAATEAEAVSGALVAQAQKVLERYKEGMREALLGFMSSKS